MREKQMYIIHLNISTCYMIEVTDAKTALLLVREMGLKRFETAQQQTAWVRVDQFHSGRCDCTLEISKHFLSLLESSKKNKNFVQCDGIKKKKRLM